MIFSYSNTPRYAPPRYAKPAIRSFWFLEKVETSLVGTEEYVHLWTTRESKTQSSFLQMMMHWFLQLFSYPQSMLPLNLFYGKMFHSKVVLLLCMYIVHYYQRAKDSMRKSGKLAALFPPQVLRGPFQQRKSTTEVVLYAWVSFTASYIFLNM